MRHAPRCVLLAFAAAGIACGPGNDSPPPEPSALVAEIALEAWEHQLSRSPYFQVRTGQLIGELPDFTPQQAAQDIAFARNMIDRIDALPLDELAHQDLLTARIIRWDLQAEVDLEPYYWLSFPYTPYMASFFFGFVHQQIPTHPFSNPVEHPNNYLLLLGEYADTLRQLQAHVEGQVERGIYVSKHALPGILGMFAAFRDSTLGRMTVTEDRLASLDADARTNFQSQVETLIEEQVLPAFDGLLDALGSQAYGAAAPDAVGLAHYPDGEAYYRTLVRHRTTMDVTPEEFHELGKRRLREIEVEMAEIRAAVGFTGTKAEFHGELQTDPRFLAGSPEEVEAKFNKYIARIEPLIGDYFWTLPKAEYGVQRLEPAAEASMTFGYYNPPTPEEPVGRYHYNGSKLDERTQIWAGPLIYHELIPGHHFHIASQSENEALPIYRREASLATAFTEGWGNYGAHLAGEMGLLSDPYDRYGALLFDAFISNRLVVDTGMNALGWTLEEGRQHMREHTLQSETEIATETLRYSTDLNAQALAYKAGLEKLLEIRERARELARDGFDIRDYHDAVLGSGAMPLEILEAHVEWYFGPDNPARAARGSHPTKG